MAVQLGMAKVNVCRVGLLDSRLCPPLGLIPVDIRQLFLAC